MRGVPMIHCANCKILHSAPDPNSPKALRWQISELAEALIDWRNTYLCPCSDIEESAARLLETTDAALTVAGIDLDAADGEEGSFVTSRDSSIRAARTPNL
jgi:hypothetical protein